jgi:hypothetical protein
MRRSTIANPIYLILPLVVVPVLRSGKPLPPTPGLTCLPAFALRAISLDFQPPCIGVIQLPAITAFTTPDPFLSLSRLHVRIFQHAHSDTKKIPEDQDGKIKEEDASYEAPRRKYRKKKTTSSNRQNYHTVTSAAATSSNP